MKSDELNRLEDLARRASTGPWRYVRVSLYARGYIINESGKTVVNTTDGDLSAIDCAYIEAAHPATILQLIERVRELENYVGSSKNSHYGKCT